MRVAFAFFLCFSVNFPRTRSDERIRFSGLAEEEFGLAAGRFLGAICLRPLLFGGFGPALLCTGAGNGDIAPHRAVGSIEWALLVYCDTWLNTLTLVRV